MARIKIEDLPENRTVTREEMEKISGGLWRFSKFPSKSPTPVSWIPAGLAGTVVVTSAAGSDDDDDDRSRPPLEP